MWHILRERLDTAASSTGRQALYQAFTNLRPTPGKPIGNNFAELLRIRNQIAGTDEAIPGVAFRMHIYKTIPPIIEMTGRTTACQPNLTVEQLIDALKEDERLRTLRTNHPATTMPTLPQPTNPLAMLVYRHQCTYWYDPRPWWRERTWKRTWWA